MIIVSQNKEKIINFDNVKALVVTNNDIGINFDNNMMMRIATYATPERAKRVLEDIYRIQGLSELYKYSDKETKEQIMEGLDKVNQIVFRYEMPKE